MKVETIVLLIPVNFNTVYLPNKEVVEMVEFRILRMTRFAI